MPENMMTRSIYMETEVNKKLKILADRENRSFNGFINLVLKDFVNKNYKPVLVKKVTLKRRAG